MTSAVRLLGPDLNSPLIINVDSGCTFGQIKEAALASWPAGSSFLAASTALTRSSD